MTVTMSTTAADTKLAFLTEKNGLGDLKSRSEVELKELLDRQNHLLSNKAVVCKLKDKGEKIRKVRDEILEELESRKSKVKVKKQIRDSTAVEWREHTKDSKESDIGENDDTNALVILSENGQIPKHNTNKSHINRLIEKEKDPSFSYRPYNSAVAEKIKNVVPEAHTAKLCPSLAKTIHLDESLNLLSNQMSILKILGSRSKRGEEIIADRMHESGEDHEQENEEIDEEESKVGLDISVNVNIDN